MRRKLVKQGASLTISLPNEWASKFKLIKGEEVDITEEDDKIVVSSVTKKNSLVKNFDFGLVPEKISRGYFLSIYLKGFTNVKLINLNEIKIKKISEAVSGLIGFEIIDTKKDSLTISDFSNYNQENIKQLQNQLYWKLSGVIQMIKDKKSPDEVFKEDLEINRISFFLQRNFNLFSTQKIDNHLKFQKISCLENIGDSLKSIAKEEKKTKILMDFLDEVDCAIQELRKLEKNNSFEDLMGLKLKIRSLKDKIDKDKILSRKTIRNFGATIKNITDIIEIFTALKITELEK